MKFSSFKPRTTPLRRKRIKPRRSSRIRDGEFMAVVRTMPCVVQGMDPCEGGIEASHCGDRGLGQKASDDTTVPKCRKHHQAWGDCSGYFKQWTPDMREHARVSWIANTQRYVGRELGRVA